ncbi:glycosyltransferase 87 family protein [Actinomycetes bacterium KLBMP 9797]
MVATTGTPAAQGSRPDPDADDGDAEQSAAGTDSRRARLSRAGAARSIVLVVAVVTTVLKILVAANTYGTNDVGYWLIFTQGVRDYGPIGIYGADLGRALYNHPPLTSYLLVVVNWLVDHGAGGVPFLIRVPASLADVVTAVVVFELVRRWRGRLAEATAAGLLVAASPVLFVISGFHGNTDPVFVMFTLLSVYLLTAHRSTLTAALAGMAYAAAVSVKLVPVMLLPVLLFAALRSGWRRAVAFLAASGAFMLVVWAPVLPKWHEFSEKVLGYEGIRVREWGLVQFAKWLEFPEVAEFLIGPGRFIALLVCAALPVLLLWRRPEALGAAVALALALFLLVSPAYGMQYLVWPLAAAYLVNFWAATVFNVVATGFVVTVYDRWNSAYPWNWNVAKAVPFDSPRLFFMAVVTWQALAAVVIAGLWLLRRPGAVASDDSVAPADSRNALS